MIRGVGSQHGLGDPMLSHFLTLELHLMGTPVCWQRRRIGYLRKRCGHCPIEEEALKRDKEKAREGGEDFRLVAESFSPAGLQEAPPTAVTSETAGYKYDPRAEEGRLCLTQQSSLDLSLLPTQQQPLPPALSDSDGTATSLSSLEREAIRTRGRPWKCRGADQNNLQQYYPVWIKWKWMTKERNPSLVIKKLEF